VCVCACEWRERERTDSGFRNRIKYNARIVRVRILHNIIACCGALWDSRRRPVWGDLMSSCVTYNVLCVMGALPSVSNKLALYTHALSRRTSRLSRGARTRVRFRIQTTSGDVRPCMRA